MKICLVCARIEMHNSFTCFKCGEASWLKANIEPEENGVFPTSKIDSGDLDSYIPTDAVNFKNKRSRR